MRRIVILFLITLSFGALAQRGVKMTEGNVSALKGVSSFNFEFVYDQVRVGKFADEQDYIDQKRADYNKKEPGKGDKWAEDWKADRKNRFEPKFIEGMGKWEYTSKSGSEYTVIFATTFIEPGYNIGISRKNAYLSGVATIVNSSDKKVVAKFTMDNMMNYGNAAWGMDFDTGGRIEGIYLSAGEHLGKMLKKQLEK